jgi:hypothetical protein
MGRLNTNTPANRQLGKEMDAVRTMAADFQRGEQTGLYPPGTADAFRRDMAVRIHSARMTAIRTTEIGVSESRMPAS